MTTRRSPTRDCRDGTWLPPSHQAMIAPRRSLQRLRCDGWWRLRASYMET